jgi:DNA-binding phage protein
MMQKNETFSRYDVADYLKSREEMAAYLTACMEHAGDDAAFHCQQHHDQKSNGAGRSFGHAD